MNGYTLFTLVNKKKYGNIAPGMQPEDCIESGSKNRPWQALWSTLPEKSRREWKSKARRLLKQTQAHQKREAGDEGRRAAERRRLQSQLARSKTNTFALIDLAAHFQLLSERMTGLANQVSQYRVISNLAYTLNNSAVGSLAMVYRFMSNLFSSLL
ncbi:unnamed protein product [Protopolystoma xenopodis]|uniref:Uncharacterized protein n=1 Tax=Protopolystoma xenopodis TaxID=117903 RepID=A0A448WLI9_9PLAT|nr:unnamed protein product [Protopolystoma xenopodis]